MLADVPLLRSRERQLPNDTPQQERFLYECWIQASWEGRHAATRWLIEFVGVVGDKNGKAVMVPGAHRMTHDFNITDLGGQLVDHNSIETTQLARLRHDINKATSHPTHASAHDQITEQRIAQVAKTIIEHLQKHVYAPVGESL